jgi:DNA-binding transcriptional ArsR family regulator
VPKFYESDLDRVFTALGDGTRRDVVARLATGGDATVGELAAAYAISLPSFSEHLGALERAGLIERSREGRHHRISLREAALADLRGWLDELSGQPAAAPAGAAGNDHGMGAAVPAPPDDAELLRRAEELLAAAASKMAIVARVLDPQQRRATMEATDFSPEAHAVRHLAQAAVETPDVRAELVEAQAQYQELARQLATARAGGAVQGLPAAVFPLARRMYAWQLHPVLKDAFPRAGTAVA